MDSADRGQLIIWRPWTTRWKATGYYRVTVTATDRRWAVTWTSYVPTITVTNVDEPGMVTLWAENG